MEEVVRRLVVGTLALCAVSGFLGGITAALIHAARTTAAPF